MTRRKRDRKEDTGRETEGKIGERQRERDTGGDRMVRLRKSHIKR
jgi:hypothetical protein